MLGNIHSIESCGTVDGPGIRYIIFTQGCLLRCQYCHNADTWKIGTGKEMSVSELVADIDTYRTFMDMSGGGVTVSGGEPLLQIDFLIELFTVLKEKGIHTCIDTSGGVFSDNAAFLEKLDRLMPLTDLVLLDLKHIDEQKHRKLTGRTNTHILQFAQYLSEKQKPVWIRYVLVPGVTDDKEDVKHLAQFISTLRNVEKVEVLPYHKLGVYKWETLGLKYPLHDVEPPTEESVKEVEGILKQAIVHT